MANYIKRVDLENRLHALCAAQRITAQDAIDIALLPAADVRPVVFCKVCKYAEIASMGHLSVCKHPKGMIDLNPNSYCSYGERRDGND